MRSFALGLLLLPMVGCICFEPGPRHGHHPAPRPDQPDGHDDGGPGDDQQPGDGGGDDPASPSDFVSGEYAAVELEVLPANVGRDIDGDGSSDNNLGVLLDELVAELGTGDWSPEDELQRQVDEGLFLPMMAARQEQGQLELEILSGFESSGLLVLDSGCLDDERDALYTLTGSFTGSDSFVAGPGSVAWCARNGDEGTLLQLPMVDTQLAGILEDDSAELTVTGVVPAVELIELLLMPYLGDEGFDVDGDGQADMSTDEVLDLAWKLAEDPGVADIELDDGSRGISVALRMAMVQAEF